MPLSGRHVCRASVISTKCFTDLAAAARSVSTSGRKVRSKHSTWSSAWLAIRRSGREQARVDGVQHRPRARDAVVDLEVAVAVPGQRGRRGRSSSQPQPSQRVGHLRARARGIARRCSGADRLRRACETISVSRGSARAHARSATRSCSGMSHHLAKQARHVSLRGSKMRAALRWLAVYASQAR